MLYAVLIAFLVALTYSQTPQQDKVEHMPGYGEYDFDIYSGMLPIAPKRQLHYVLVESQSNPSKDPLVVWLNGGPGCSSLLGLIQENGPFLFTGVNKYFTENLGNSWNKQANILYIEGPAGVGFSTTQEKFYQNNDDRTAADFTQALVLFRQRFNNTSLNFNNKLFLSGESYAGMYIPFFANTLLDYNQANPATKFNFKGFLIGNGAFEFHKTQLQKYIMGFYVDNHFVNPTLREYYEKGCKKSIFSVECSKFMTPYNNVMNNTDRYAIYNYTYSYGKLPVPGGRQEQFLLNKALQNQDLPEYVKKMFVGELRDEDDEENDSGEKNSVEDPMEIISEYFNLEEVQEALHVPKMKWKTCNLGMNILYKSANNSTYLYPRFLREGLDILIFSGNTDAMVNGQYTFDNLQILFNDYNTGLSVDQEWRQWHNDDQVAGMIRYYKTQKGNKFIHAMVRDAGHEVPMYQPEAAYKMFNNFINGQNID